ncbi:hypothetical protein D9M69_512700 [compost metagenome]
MSFAKASAARISTGWSSMPATTSSLRIGASLSGTIVIETNASSKPPLPSETV